MITNTVVMILAIVAVVITAGYLLFTLSKKKKKPRRITPAETPVSVTPTPGLVSAPKLEERLQMTRGKLWGRVSSLVRSWAGSEISSQKWEELEEVLLEGDVGVATSQFLLEKVKDRLKGSSQGDPLTFLTEEAELLFSTTSPTSSAPPKPWVISIVGVNGVGKTTTVGKLSNRFRKEGKSVLIGATDTFRAAAMDQLRVWAERTGAQFVSGREGGDPGAVAFDSVTAGKARGVDIVLLDTAGRLHTKANLMDELKKVHRVVKKVIPEAPHEIWLVLDGNLGQNSVYQAREFQKALELSGVVVTKLDGTAKGGALLSIARELNLPVRFIGIGESQDDLIRFQAHEFVSAVLGTPSQS